MIFNPFEDTRSVLITVGIGIGLACFIYFTGLGPFDEWTIEENGSFLSVAQGGQNELFHDVTITNQSIYAVGERRDGGNSSAYVLKMGLNGRKKWDIVLPLIKQHSEKGVNALNAVSHTAKGTVIGVGEITLPGKVHQKPWIVEFTPEGNVKMSKILELQTATKVNTIHRTRNNNYLLAGTRSPINETQKTKKDAFIVKMTSNGEILWNTSIKQSHEDNLRDVVETTSGNIIAVGDTENDRGYVTKFTSDGNHIWSRQLFLSKNKQIDYTFNTVILQEDTFVLNGSVESRGRKQGILVGMDAKGNIVWTKQGANIRDIVPITQSHIAFVGTGESRNPVTEDPDHGKLAGLIGVFNIKNKTVEWMHSVDQHSHDIRFSGVTYKESQGIVAVGRNNDSPNYNVDGYVMKLDKKGNDLKKCKFIKQPWESETKVKDTYSQVTVPRNQHIYSQMKIEHIPQVRTHTLLFTSLRTQCS